MRTIQILITGLFVTAFCGSAMAGPITCGSADREASMDDAVECFTGLGNPQDSPELQDYWPGDEWMDAGRAEGGDPDGFLGWLFVTGGWDEGEFTGEWTILDGFWAMYSEAVITIHVGEGGGDPDHFAFLINPGDTFGTLEYARCDTCEGGGFSNIVLWGRGAGSVPEPAAALLLGSGLLMLAAMRRRRKHQ